MFLIDLHDSQMISNWGQRMKIWAERGFGVGVKEALVYILMIKLHSLQVIISHSDH